MNRATVAADLARRSEIFVKHHRGKGCFAPFTGSDYSAWRAFCYLVESYSYGGGEGAIRAMSHCLEICQWHTATWLESGRESFAAVLRALWQPAMATTAMMSS